MLIYMSDCLCENCNTSLTDNCIYICTDTDYRINDDNNNLVKILSTHNFNSDDEEIGNFDYVKFCSMCDCYYRYPYSYDSTNNVFKTRNNDNIIYYDNFLKDNVIHNFSNITCKYCNNTLQQGNFTMQIISETTENFNNFCWPIDFIQNVNIYNESSSSLIKTITPSSYNDYVNLQKFTTSIGKKIIYCSSCNFFISNSLEEFYYP